MTLSTRILMQTLAALAIVASTVGAVLYGVTDAAYAAHVDRGTALLRGHRTARTPCAAPHAGRTISRMACPQGRT
jgi:hypothetical protein